MAEAQGGPAKRRETLAGYGSHVRMLWSTSPGWSTACLISSIVSAACAIANIVAIGQLVGALGEVVTDPTVPERLWTWFGVFASAAIMSQVAAAALRWCGAHVHAAYRVRVDELVAETGLHPRDLGRLEDEEFSGGLEALTANSRHWLFRFGLTGTWELLSARLTALGSVAIVLSWRWWIPFVVIACFVVVSRVSAWWLDDVLDNLWSRPSTDKLRAGYVSRLMTRPEAAKEIRLFGIADWLGRRYALLWHAFATRFWRRSRRKLSAVVAVSALEILVIGGTLALLAHDTYQGQVSTAAVTTYALAILALDAFGPQGDTQAGLIRVAVFLRRLLALRRSVGLPRFTLVPASMPSAPTGGAADVEIADLTFTYPTRGEPTLRGLSLTVPAGQSLAVVGVNGAGKSTLMKLLAGLYRPDDGTVRVAGSDPFAEESAGGGRVAVVFQDFVRYPLPLRDNIGFGALGREDDQNLLDAAMRDAAAGEVLHDVNGDWDTPLSQEVAGGTDLSGGQWQRVALARALASVGGGAGVLVLDEPTAALDVRAEAEIFDRFLAMTQGVTTILVSHRLSTVRRAERIVVLDDTGQITEDGSHEELMARGGAYAQMFTLQAARFAAAGGVGAS